jgi:hypothetical protein
VLIAGAVRVVANAPLLDNPRSLLRPKTDGAYANNMHLDIEKLGSSQSYRVRQ